MMAGYLRSTRTTLLALVIGCTLASCGSTARNDSADSTVAQTGTAGTATGTSVGTPPAQPPATGTAPGAAPAGTAGEVSGGLTASTPDNVITTYTSGGGQVCDMLTAQEASEILGIPMKQETANDNCTIVPAGSSVKTMVSISTVTNPNMFEALTRGGEQLSGYGDKAMVNPPIMGILKGHKAVMISLVNADTTADMKDMLLRMGAKIAPRM